MNKKIFAYVGGIAVLMTIVVLAITSESQVKEDKVHNMKIVSIGSQTTPDETKFHNPMAYYMVLL